MEQEVEQSTEILTGRERSLLNLRPPWPKGISPNPGGRPKRKPITEAYEELLTPVEARKVAKAMLSQAKRGNVKAAVEVTDRVEGKLSYDEPDRTPGGIQVLVINEIVRPEAPSETKAK